MTTNQFKTLLKKMGACKSARDWVQRQIKKGKSPKEIWEGCNNEHYLFWLHTKLYVFDWDKYHDFKVEHDMYSLVTYSKEFLNLRKEFIRKSTKYKDFHKAAIKRLKQK